jgi:predicted PurR-regulated permease PerM
MADERRPLALIIWAVLAVGAAAGVAWGVYLARGALLLIYISVLLAIGFRPIVRWLEVHPILRLGARRAPRWLAILVVYLTIMATLTIAGILVVPPLIAQSEELWNRTPALLDRAQDFLVEHNLLTHRITLREAVSRAPGTPGSAVGTVVTAVGRVVAGVLGFVTVLILTFYLLVESESLFVGFARLFPTDARPRVMHMSREISAKVSAWLNGQFILASVIGTSAAMGLYLLNVPYFYVLGLVAAIGETVPVIGPVISMVPAVLAGLSVSAKTALFVGLFWIGQQQIENHLLVPKVMQRQVGVNPVIVIAALLVGGSILGILGAVLAVPTAAIVQVIVQAILDERDRPKVEPLITPRLARTKDGSELGSEVGSS